MVEFIGGKMDYSPVFNEVRIQLPTNLNDQNADKLIMPEDAFDLSVFDITIVELLANGVLQKDIPKFLHSKNLQPSGLSSVEKRLTLMREKLSLKSNAEL